MRIHHLNCGTMRMPGAPLVCHVLLWETATGLVLIDTGFGLGDIADQGVLLVPLYGHSRGHTAVAVNTGERWVLHAGDSFYHPGTLDHSATPPLSLRLQEAAFAIDRKKLRENQARLGELLSRREPDLLIVNAHDPGLLEAALRAA